MFFFPWYPALMLAVEANNVIDIRMRKISTAGFDAVSETRMMVAEKLDAFTAAGLILMQGGNALSVIDNYRKLVAANADRLGD